MGKATYPSRSQFPSNQVRKSIYQLQGRNLERYGKCMFFGSWRRSILGCKLKWKAQFTQTYLQKAVIYIASIPYVCRIELR